MDPRVPNLMCEMQERLALAKRFRGDDAVASIKQLNAALFRRAFAEASRKVRMQMKAVDWREGPSAYAAGLPARASLAWRRPCSFAITKRTRRAHRRRPS